MKCLIEFLLDDGTVLRNTPLNITDKIKKHLDYLSASTQ
jgi:hypothetical protein